MPERLGEAPDLDPRDVVEIRDFRLSGTNINGQNMEMDRIDAVVEAGSTERWVVRNEDGDPHNFHIHVQFVVVEPGEEAGEVSQAGHDAHPDH